MADKPNDDKQKVPARSPDSWFGRWQRRRRQRHGADLRLPPMGRRARVFSIVIFALLFVAILAVLAWDPFELLRNTADTEAVGEGVLLPAPEAQHDALYQCSMHRHVIESEPGDCPICGMSLLPMTVTGEATRQTVPAAEGEILYWYAPMDPTYMTEQPGLSPMGMPLVPKYADQVTAEQGVIKVDPVQVQNMGVTSIVAHQGTLRRTVNTVGILDFDADRLAWVNTKFSGWVEKVYVTYVGQDVKAGQPLFEIYSPELVTTQDEYLRAIDYSASLATSKREEARRQAESLLRSTRDRLLYWDITPDQIQELETTHRVQRLLTVFAPQDGVVVEIMAETLEGMFVEPGTNLYQIADLSSIWVHADIYESDLPWIRAGQPAEISFRFDADRRASGEILFLYPEVSKETRTLRICVEVPNAERRLRPGMYADVELLGPAIPDAVLIPSAAVLRSGERELVFIDLGGGRFAPREVVLGVRGEDDLVQVLSGVVPGEAVVTQAQFMLDSESRVQEALAKFMRRGATGGPRTGAVHEAPVTAPQSPLPQTRPTAPRHDPGASL